MTPSVAKALSQSDKSNTDVGLNATMTNTEMASEVNASALFESKNKILDIISINPDLKTDAENPVKAI